MLLLSGSASGQSSGCGFHRRHCPAIAPCIACCALCVATALHSLRLSVCRPDAPHQVPLTTRSWLSSCRTLTSSDRGRSPLRGRGGRGARPCTASRMAADHPASQLPVRAAPACMTLIEHCMPHTCMMHGLSAMMHEYAACAGHVTDSPCV